MEDNDGHDRPSKTGRNPRRLLGAAGLLAGGALAGVVIASSLTASAAENSSSASSSSAPAASTSAAPGHGDARGATPVRPGEKQLTGTTAEKVRAAALKAVPGGTVYRVETDVDGATYEAHMTKADGSLVTVLFDKNFAVTSVQAGMGPGGPQPGR